MFLRLCRRPVRIPALGSLPKPEKGFSRGLANSPPDCWLRLRRRPVRIPPCECHAKRKRTPFGRPFPFGGPGGIRTHGTLAGTPDFECCLSLADSWLEQVGSGSFVRSRNPRRHKGLRTFRPVSAGGDLNRPKVQIKPRSCVKSRRSCAFARSQARKQRPRQRR